MELIPYREFAELRLCHFYPDTAKIVGLEDWEFMGGIWVGEAIAFTDFLRPDHREEELGAIDIYFAELPAGVGQAILDAIHLPLQQGMSFDQMIQILGTPADTLIFAEDRKSYDYTLGSQFPYHISCTIHESDGLIYLSVIRKDMLAEFEAINIKELAEEFQALEKSDNSFQRRARILQSLWREDQEYPIGEKENGKPLGSRLAIPWAEETLGNFLTETIRGVVRREALSNKQEHGRLLETRRLISNLLSSQPLCFNLFGELQQDLPLASRIFADLTARRVHEVTRIAFEYSPGRGNPHYTGDFSAFDVYVEFTTPNNSQGFIGIEVKYHENLQGKPAAHRPRYDEVAAAMGCFRDEALAQLRQAPLQQIWRDHLLAGSLLQQDQHFADGFFVFLYPKDNTHCVQAVADYQASLRTGDTFIPWTLEAVHAALVRQTDAEWISAFYDRYLDFDGIDRLLE